MPISTLWEKSMPSTNSRKPWTKCWRNCSPSLTMSTPASSWTLTARRVASSFAAASSPPPSRHGAHSLFGSASQEGFGRLPATVVGNMAILARWHPSGPPTVEPVVAPQQALAAPAAQGAVAEKRRNALQVIDAAVPARNALHPCGAAPALPFVPAQGSDRLVRHSCKAIGEY